MATPREHFETLSDLYYSLKKEKFPQIVLAIFVAVIIAAVLMTVIEASPEAMLDKHPGFLDRLATAIYYGVVTITTVGYGDYSPQTAGGRFLAVVLMLFGMVSVSMLTATIASIFVERKLREGRGLMMLKDIRNHIVFCGWKKDLAKLLTEILEINRDLTSRNIVVIANITPDEIDVFRQQNPMLRDVHIIRGEQFNENILSQANIREARTAYILADESSPASVSEIDSKTVMAAMAIGAMTKNIHVCAELLDVKFRSYLENAHVTEIIFSSEYSRFLIANSTISTGITKVINELLDVSKGASMVTERLPEGFAGRTFGELRAHYAGQGPTMLIGLLENIGSYYERKQDALAEAQKTADISQLVRNLNQVKQLKSNQPVINPPDDHPVGKHSLAILIRGQEERSASTEPTP